MTSLYIQPGFYHQSDQSINSNKNSQNISSSSSSFNQKNISNSPKNLSKIRLFMKNQNQNQNHSPIHNKNDVNPYKENQIPYNSLPLPPSKNTSFSYNHDLEDPFIVNSDYILPPTFSYDNINDFSKKKLHSSTIKISNNNYQNDPYSYLPKPSTFKSSKHSLTAKNTNDIESEPEDFEDISSSDTEFDICIDEILSLPYTGFEKEKALAKIYNLPNKDAVNSTTSLLLPTAPMSPKSKGIQQNLNNINSNLSNNISNKDSVLPLPSFYNTPKTSGRMRSFSNYESNRITSQDNNHDPVLNYFIQAKSQAPINKIASSPLKPSPPRLPSSLPRVSSISARRISRSHSKTSLQYSQSPLRKTPPSKANTSQSFYSCSSADSSNLPASAYSTPLSSLSSSPIKKSPYNFNSKSGSPNKIDVIVGFNPIPKTSENLNLIDSQVGTCKSNESKDSDFHLFDFDKSVKFHQIINGDKNDELETLLFDSNDSDSNNKFTYKKQENFLRRSASVPNNLLHGKFFSSAKNSFRSHSSKKNFIHLQNHVNVPSDDELNHKKINHKDFNGNGQKNQSIYKESPLDAIIKKINRIKRYF